jgi:alkylation response protein AidB-like acyl-CoA dehydrogenase
MLQLAVDYAKVREQFGRPVGSFQAVKHHLADALLRADFAAAPVYRAAWSLSGRSPRAAVDVSMAKVYASEAAVFVGKKALQVHGAIGYTTECDLHHWMKRAWALSRAWGDPATHRARLQAAVLGAPSGDTEPLDSFSAETL